MLEKFTPEEIRQLKKELMFYRSGYLKNTTVENANHELRKLFGYDTGKYNSGSEDIASIGEVEKAMLVLVDTALHNFQYKRKKEILGNGTVRTWVIPKRVSFIYSGRVSADEYEEMYEELLNVFKKHFKKVTKKEAETIGMAEGTINGVSV